MRIIVPQGYHAGYMEFARINGGGLPGERELLLPRQTRIKVKKILPGGGVEVEVMGA